MRSKWVIGTRTLEAIAGLARGIGTLRRNTGAPGAPAAQQTDTRPANVKQRMPRLHGLSVEVLCPCRY